MVERNDRGRPEWIGNVDRDGGRYAGWVSDSALALRLKSEGEVLDLISMLRRVPEFKGIAMEATEHEDVEVPQ